MRIRTKAFIAGAILSLAVLSGSRLFAQTYSIEYKGRVWASIPVDPQEKNNNRAETGDSTSKEIRNDMSIFPVSVSIVYTIISDGNYMILRGSLDSSVMEIQGIKANRTDEDEEVIIDIRQKLIFFPSSKIIRKIKLYSLGNPVVESGDCMEKNVVEKGPQYRIALCKSLPACITPLFFFSGNQPGIRSVSTPTQFIELRSYKKVKPDKRLSECPAIFKRYPVSDEEEAFFD